MRLSKSQRKEVQEVISKMECPKDFACYRSDFEKVCNVKEVGPDNLVCLGSAADRVCGFTTPFEYDYLCGCPLRIYVGRILGIS